MPPWKVEVAVPVVFTNLEVTPLVAMKSLVLIPPAKVEVEFTPEIVRPLVAVR